MLDQTTPGGIALLLVLAALVSVASWTDIKERRIPNWVSAATAVTGLAAVGLTAGPPSVGWAALHLFVALVIGIGLTAARVLGAGDAKFYAALAAWMPIQAGLFLLVSVAIAGLALLLLFTMARRGRVKRKEEIVSDFDKLPYGVAIGIGGLLAVAFA